ncbi:DUF6233 domain-containing protein [Streptomyces sp900116325]|uniref:DUF6233 domain-containing protein n=1 Tax=Streptomyces sp. 900116325 TaxID=3154295 RepID=UPI0033333E07
MPDWIVELSIVLGARPFEVQVGGYAGGEAPAGHCREQAPAALADGIRAGIHCRPDTELGVLGWVGRRSSREKHLSHHP